MTRGSAPRHPSLARLDRQSAERPVGIRDVLGALVARLTEVFELSPQQDQLAYLVRKQCDLLQGYYFARPMYPDDVPDILRQDFTGELNSAASG